MATSHAAGKTYAATLNYSEFVEADVNEESIQVMSAMLILDAREQEKREKEAEVALLGTVVH